ncbi:MAG: TetR/AcrR family transcriptional regulator [Ilumatobacteraceae bacterium]
MVDRRPRASSTTEEILDAAEEILKRRGSEGLSVRAVAQKIGISVGNLQYHFPTRAKLIDAVFSRRGDEFRAAILGKVENLDDPRERFETIVDLWLASQHQPDQALFWHLWAISAHDVDAKLTMKKVYNEMIDYLRLILREIDPDLSVSHARRKAALIVSMVEGSGLFVGHGRQPERGLGSLQVEVKRAVMELAGCAVGAGSKARVRRKAAK